MTILNGGIGAVFWEGFFADEGGWRWMSTIGHMRVPSVILPAEIYFELSCGQPECYDRFPFDLRIFAGGKLVRSITFRRGEPAEIVQMYLDQPHQEVPIRLESAESFVPSLCGKSNDIRRISVRLSHLRIEPIAEPQQNKASNNQTMGARLEPSNLYSLSHRSCPLCGNAQLVDRQLLGCLPSSSPFGPRKYHLVSCSHCGLIYLSPLPNKEVLDAIYVHSPQFDACACYKGRRTLLAIGFRLAALLEHLDLMFEPVRVLEIGGGLSWMSRAAKFLNKRSITVVQDISSETAGACRWVDHYVVGDLTDKLDEIGKYGPFQIISLTHVIEHLPDPLGTLQICRQLLECRGRIFVTAPQKPTNWSLSDPFTAWETWNYAHVPAHLQYFDGVSMRRCADLAGLNMVYYDASPEGGQALEAWLSKAKPEQQWSKKSS